FREAGPVWRRSEGMFRTHWGHGRCDDTEATMLKRRVYEDPSDLESLREEWEALAARSTANEPTLSPDWMTTWWRVFGGEGGRALRLLEIRSDDKLVGLAPLVSRTTSYRPGIPFRRLELMASGEDEQEEICSEYIGVIADRNHEGAVVDSLAEALVSGELGGWNEVLLPSMDGGQMT